MTEAHKTKRAALGAIIAAIVCLAAGALFYAAAGGFFGKKAGGGTPTPAAEEEAGNNVDAENGAETYPTANEITLEDNNQTIAITVNETIYLNLGGGYNWDVSFEPAGIVERENDAAGAEGYYVARMVGQTVMRAAGTPACRPDCATPGADFSLTIEVVRHPGPINLEQSL